VRAYLCLLDEASKPFSCSLCGTFPRFLCFDGVSLAMKKTNVNWETVETIYPKTSDTVPLEGTLPFRDRLIFPSVDGRNLLLQFCSGNPALDEDGFTELLNIAQNELPPLHTILVNLMETEKKKMQGKQIGFFCFPGIWKQFFLLIGSSSSVALYLKPAALPAVEHLIQSRIYTKSHHEVIIDLCPPLAFLLVRQITNQIPQSLADLLKLLVSVVRKTHPTAIMPSFEVTDKSYINVSLLSSSTSSSSSSSSSSSCFSSSSFSSVDSSKLWINELKELREQIQTERQSLTIDVDTSDYPVIPELDSKLSGLKWHWKKLRTLPRFEGFDNVKKTKEILEWSDTFNEDEEKDIFCIKEEQKGYAGKKHTAGLFVGCCCHGIGYGFHSMVAPEGRKDLMKVLYEHMPQKVLDQLIVVFDFNCQEGEYMLNRCPELFQHTRLYIDRFHSKTHKCLSTFKLEAFPVYQELISTSSESLNFILQRLHSQTPFMTQELFVDIIIGIIGVRNALGNAKFLELKNKYIVK